MDRFRLENRNLYTLFWVVAVVGVAIEVDVDEADMLVGTRLVVVLVTTLGDSVDVAISLVSLVLGV